MLFLAISVFLITVLVQSPSTYGQNTTTEIIFTGDTGTLPQLLYSQSLFCYYFINSAELVNVTYNYQATGSGAAQSNFISNLIDFMGSDAPFSSTQLASLPDIIFVPTVATAVVPIFNIPNFANLVLDGVTLANIFDLNITVWNHPSIVQYNPALANVNETINVIVRSDGSGTTFIFTQALSSFSVNFNNTVGHGTSVPWPAGVVKKPKSDGVIAAVLASPYTISYGVLADALAYDTNYAKMYNSANQLVSPNSKSVSFAAAELGTGDELSSNATILTASLVNARNGLAWPIAGYTYMGLQANIFRINGTCATKKAAVEFWIWYYSAPEVLDFMSEYQMSPVPLLMQTKILQLLHLISCQNVVLSAPTVTPVISSYVPTQIASIIDILSLSYKQIDASYYLGVNHFSLASSSSSSASSNSSTSTDTLVIDDSLLFSSLSTSTGNTSGGNLSSDSSSFVGFLVDCIHNPTFQSELQQESNSSSSFSQPFLSSENGNNITLVIPLGITAVVPIYNLKPITSLYLSLPVIALIMTGSIKYWNDTQIANLNPNIASQLPPQLITVFVVDSTSSTATLSLFQFLNISDWSESDSNYIVVEDDNILKARVLNQVGAFGYSTAVDLTVSSASIPSFVNVSSPFTFIDTCVQKNDCWPMWNIYSVNVGYVFQDVPFSVCKSAEFVYYFIKWMFESTGQLSSLGTGLIVSSTTTASSELVYNALLSGTCNNNAIIVNAPTVTPNGGNFSAPLTAKLTASVGAEIYYTLDNTPATTNSLQYDSNYPIEISKYTTIRAIAQVQGMLASSEVQVEFIVDIPIPPTVPTANTMITILEAVIPSVFVVLLALISVGYYFYYKSQQNIGAVIDFKDITIIETIFTSEMSSVYSAKYNGMEVAVKLFKLKGPSKTRASDNNRLSKNPSSSINSSPPTIRISKSGLINDTATKVTEFDLEAQTIVTKPQNLTVVSSLYRTTQVSRFTTTAASNGRVKTKSKRDLKNLFLGELKIVTKLRHPNIVFNYGYFIQSDSEMGLVLELMSSGSLYNVLHNMTLKLSWAQRIGFAEDAAKGMAFLHAQSPPILHRDVKSLNFLLDERFILKIADFGLSQQVDMKYDGNQIDGTLPWLAPEILIHYQQQQNSETSSSDNSNSNRLQVTRNREISFNTTTASKKKNANHVPSTKDDIYGFGIVLWELFSRDDPFGDVENFLSEGIEKICSEEIRFRPPIDSNWPKEYVELMQSCWHHTPEKRPEFEDIKRIITSLKSLLSVIEHDEKELIATNDKGHLSLNLERTEGNSSTSSLSKNAVTILRYILAPEEFREVSSKGVLKSVLKFPKVCMFFADIVNYTGHSELCEAVAVSDLLTGLFAKYRTAAASVGIFEVETIGDMYIAATGFKEEEDSTQKMLAFAIKVVEILKGYSWLLFSGENAPIEMRIGLHCGSCAGTIIGPKFTILGDTVNIASRMESSGVPLQIHATETFVNEWKKSVEASDDPISLDKRSWVSRGPMQIKGKGAMHTFLYKVR